MKNTVKYLGLFICLAFGATLAHACPGKGGAAMHGQQMGKKMCDQKGGGMHGHMGGMMCGNMDANGDGTVDRGEFDAFHNEHFKMMDANGDGKIDSDEMEACRRKCTEKAKAL